MQFSEFSFNSAASPKFAGELKQVETTAIPAAPKIQAGNIFGAAAVATPMVMKMQEVKFETLS
jgi:hypothetical protein